MFPLSPLSSPESGLPISPDRPKHRRLTQDLEEYIVPMADKPLLDHFNSWASFFDLYGDTRVPIDQEQDPFDEQLPLPSSIPPVSPSSESYPSSPDSSGQSIETNLMPHDLMTPIRRDGEGAGEALLGQTLDLGNCTYELEHNNLTSTVSKLNTTRSISCDKSILRSDFGISSTPLNTGIKNLTTDLITSDSPQHPNPLRCNHLLKSPIPSSKPLLSVKTADSTIDLDVDNETGVVASTIEPLITETRPPPAKEPATNPVVAKPPTRLPRSTIPVMARRTSASSDRPLRGMRPASSTSSLTQVHSRPSLLPTSFKSRSHERINAPAGSHGFYFKK